MIINRKVQIFIDGPCRSDPSRGGWGVLLRSGKIEKELWGGEPYKTTNRVELASAIRGLEAQNRASSIMLATDSPYVLKGVSDWAKGWKNASRQPVKNRGLWKRLNEPCETRKVDCRLVKGLSVRLKNEWADGLGKRGMDELGEGR